MRLVLGIDIGGTTFTVGAISTEGRRVGALREEPTNPKDGADGVLHRIAAAGRAVMDDARRVELQAEFIGIGAGAPGPLDAEAGVVLLTPNLGWVDYPLRDRLQAALGLPTVIDNDANCAVLGEWWRGAAQGTRHAIGFTIGTGIGGGLIVDGKLYHGASGCAGEIGHTTIEANGRHGACGNYGCLEAYASGLAIARRAVEAIESGEVTTLLQRAGGDPARISARTVYDAAHDGDELARELVHETAQFLGAGVANLVNVFNPEVVVVCGGVTRAGDLLFVPLRREVARRAFKPAVQAVRIVAQQLEAPGVFGAARVFLERAE
ncbi:MAG TPA: ROK family protein [Gemmatimonadales bacterium]|nr:ROK family protein [Gemmatimonadales bacterium]